jgi:hypothetical protein
LRPLLHYYLIGSSTEWERLDHRKKGKARTHIQHIASLPYRSGQEWTGKDRTGQDRTGQDRTGQNRTGQDRTGQDRREKKRIGQGKKGLDRDLNISGFLRSKLLP